MNVFDQQFFEFQMTQLGWKGITSGALYSLFRPDPSHIDLLAEAIDSTEPEFRWACDCALAQLRDLSWPEQYSELQQPVTIIKDAISRVTVTQTPIRRALSAEETAAFETLKIQVRDAYREHGAESANELFRTSQLYEWHVPYPNWLSEYASSETSLAKYPR